MIAQRLQRLRYDTWAEFQWDVAMEKAAVNRWGSTATPEPIVGVEVQLHSQTWWFTQDKVKRLINNINEIRQESIDHPRCGLADSWLALKPGNHWSSGLPRNANE